MSSAAGDDVKSSRRRLRCVATKYMRSGSLTANKRASPYEAQWRDFVTAQVNS